MSTSDKPTPEDAKAEKRDAAQTDQVEDAEIVDDTSADAGVPEDGSDAPPEDDAATDDAAAEDAPDEVPVEDATAEQAATAEPVTETPEETPEPESETEPEAAPVTLPTAPVEVPRVKRGPGFVTLLLGGVCAGAIGYVLAFATEFKPFAGPTGPDPQVVALGDDVAALEGQTADATAAANAAAEAAAAAAAQASTLSDSLSALDAQVTQLTPGQDDIPPALIEELQSAAAAEVAALGDRVAATEAVVETVQAQVADFERQLAALDAAGNVSAGETLAELEAQSAALQDALQAQNAAFAEAEARIAEMSAAAATQQSALLTEAALARVRAAVTAGGGFAGPLAELQQAGAVEIPAALSAVAEGGVKSLPQLQDSFAAAARAALEAAISSEAGTGTAMDRIGKFLQSQTGARSLAERDGDDPDAVLSRAEARLSEGNVDAALSEIASLNAAGQAAMADWVAAAEARVAALQAVDTLSAALAAE